MVGPTQAISGVVKASVTIVDTVFEVLEPLAAYLPAIPGAETTQTASVSSAVALAPVEPSDDASASTADESGAITLEDVAPWVFSQTAADVTLVSSSPLTSSQRRFAFHPAGSLGGVAFPNLPLRDSLDTSDSDSVESLLVANSLIGDASLIEQGDFAIASVEQEPVIEKATVGEESAETTPPTRENDRDAVTEKQTSNDGVAPNDVSTEPAPSDDVSTEEAPVAEGTSGSSEGQKAQTLAAESNGTSADSEQVLATAFRSTNDLSSNFADVESLLGESTPVEIFSMLETVHTQMNPDVTAPTIGDVAELVMLDRLFQSLDTPMTFGADGYLETAASDSGVSVTQAPEPSTLLMISLGAVAWRCHRRLSHTSRTE